MSQLQKFDIEDGKYTICYDEDDCEIVVLRYGELWVRPDNQKLMLCILQKLQWQQREIEALESLTKSIDGAGKTHEELAGENTALQKQLEDLKAAAPVWALNIPRHSLVQPKLQGNLAALWAALGAVDQEDAIARIRRMKVLS